jgi:4-hydroxythreonine-4-phosphate dehydrogenase
MSRPVVAITMGDPAGIGPEVAVKGLTSGAPVLDRCAPRVVGDAGRLRAAADACGLSADDIDCLDLGNVPPDLPFGRLDPRAGQAAYEYVIRAVELATAGEAAAVCTLPLNKEALRAAGHPQPGHTELLAELTGTDEVSMMLDTGGFTVAHVTTHVGLLDAVERIEPGLVHRTIVRADDALRRRGGRPRIAVCGINPHAGENGLFGRGEEEAKIVPAVERARAEGIDVVGPLPADTLFFRARRGDFDCVVAMYHDQGHGPVKVLGLERGVNITIGLPIVRTSVDHGTAFDIAGTGAADPGSFLAALESAVALAG